MAKDQKTTAEQNAGQRNNGTDNTENELKTNTQLEQKDKKDKKQSVKVLHVVAKREGFRRAGFAFGSDRTRLVVDDLSAEQVRQLKEEQMLVVTEATEQD